jgi:fatty acid desaturase
MPLSARELRILSEIERDLRESSRRTVWACAMIAGLLAGIALLWSGVVLGIPAMILSGAVLTQLSPIALVTRGLLAALSRRRSTRAIDGG